MKGKSNSKGITLIALVVTIVVIVLLGGMSINLLFGNEGILDKAKEAGKEYDVSAIKESLELEKAPVQLEKLGTVNLEDYLAQITSGNKNFEVSVDENNGTEAEITVNGKHKFFLKDNLNGNVEII